MNISRSLSDHPHIVGVTQTHRGATRPDASTEGVDGMPSYDVEVRRDQRVLQVFRGAELADLDRAWDFVSALSRNWDSPGTRILVRDDRGDVVISIGVVAARKTRAA
jgi:hypothetical protein